MSVELSSRQWETLRDAARNPRGEVSYIPGMGFHQPRTLMVLFRLGLLEDRGGWVGRITAAGRAAIDANGSDVVAKVLMDEIRTLSAEKNVKIYVLVDDLDRRCDRCGRPYRDHSIDADGIVDVCGHYVALQDPDRAAPAKGSGHRSIQSPPTEVEELRRVVARLLGAMRTGVEVGCVDHLDCADDAGAFWHEAIEDAERVLAGKKKAGPA